MWKNNLFARIFQHGRSSTESPETNPNSLLIPREESRLISNYRSLQQLDVDGRWGQCAEPQVPAASNGPAVSALLMPTGADAAHQVVHDIEATHLSGRRNFTFFLIQEVDTACAVAPLSAYCFMTGFMDAISFSSVSVWCAFQTGNSLQLSFAVAQLANGHPLQIADKQAFCAVLCFVFGAFIARIGDKIGCKTRAWMTLGTLIQTILTMVAAIAVWKTGSGVIGEYHGKSAWSNSFVTLGFMSASMGLQGVMGKRLNTQFTTTVVLTATWCDFVTEPQLFNFHLVPSRDHKAMAIFFLFIGGFSGRMILDYIGSAGVLGVGSCLRLLIALWWLLVPAKKAE